MPHSSIDSLTSPTLKHLRERWWDDEFTEFLTDTLRPRPGNRILNVGCGTGEAEVSIGRLHISQLRLFGVDLKSLEVIAASTETAAHNITARYAAGDACRLPFKEHSFDATFCVAVLQHIGDVERAVSELARVTVPAGRVLAVEPDNAAHYAYASVQSGIRAFEIIAKLFAAVAAANQENTHPAIGPQVPELFLEYGLEPIGVRLFPVSDVTLGAPSSHRWHQRKAAIEGFIQHRDSWVQTLADEAMAALGAYEADATAAGAGFVEIQNTILIATVGQKAS
jgi:SAM-dependent methyltransferase